jgi:hypothetical protein
MRAGSRKLAIDEVVAGILPADRGTISPRCAGNGIAWRCPEAGSTMRRRALRRTPGS